ncbi:hypothetical protein SESBI_12900 [Sesbania bispinosa]|nr:hypothetical protein SESBI_12900 [Sesbania bispinosa]
MALSQTPPKWWHWFQGYEGKPNTDVNSVFDRRYPTEQVIRSHFFKAEDCVRVHKVGMLNTAKIVQTFAIQSAFLGHALESGIALLEKELKEKNSKAEGSRRRDCLGSRRHIRARESPRKAPKSEEKLQTEQDNRKSEVINLMAEISFQYEQMFEKVIGQLKFLYPDLNVEEVGAFKEIQDEKLVEIPDDEE